MVSDMEEKFPSGSTAVTVQKGACERVEELTASTMPSARQSRRLVALSLLEFNEQVWQAAAQSCAW